MIFQSTIITPYGTSRTDPLVSALKVTYGAIYKVQFQFRLGNALTLGVRVLDNTFQIYPSSPNEWLRGHGVVIDFEDRYKKFVEPWEFIIETYNESTRYDHEMIVRIGMATTQDEIAALYPSLSLSELSNAITQSQELESESRRNIFQRALSTLKKVAGV